MTLRRRKTGLIATVGLIIICLTLNMFIPIYNENGIHLGESSRSLANRLELIDSTSPSNNINNTLTQIITSGPVYSIVKVIDYEKTAMDTLEPSQIIDYLLWTNQPSCQMAQYFVGRMVTSADGLARWPWTGRRPFAWTLQWRQFRTTVSSTSLASATNGVSTKP
jgi:hypothetical protein